VRRILPSLVRLRRRIEARLFARSVPEEVEDELAFHVEMRIRQLLAEGMTLEQARAAAIARFGDIEEVKATCRRLGREREGREMRNETIGELARDVRFALRHLRRSPGLTVTAVLTLGLGIGATTAVFTVVNGVILTPLPFPEPERLVEVRTRYLPPSGFDIDRFPISIPEFIDYRDASESYEALGVYTLGTRTLTPESGEPLRVDAVFLDRAALEALAVEPVIGRWFTEEEDLPSAAVGLISYDLWTSSFGRDPDIVGQTIPLVTTSFLVTGVMPEGFAFPSARYQLFENFGIDPANPGGRASHGSVGIGRVRAGVTLERLTDEAARIHAPWADTYEHNVAHFPILEGLPDNIVGTDVRRALSILGALVGLVLLIAAANVASLLLARGDDRRQEIAVRNSLGAGQGRIARQLLTESVVLGVLGAGLGLAVGQLALRSLLAIDPTALPRSELIGLDANVLAFTAAVSVLTALVFGLAPALQARGVPATTLTSDLRATSGRRRLRARQWLVSAQMALSLLVLAAAGLTGRSLATLLEVDPGVDVESRLVFSLSATPDAYPDREALVQLYQGLQERLGALPGVVSVAAVTHLPLSASINRNDFDIEGREQLAGEPIFSAQWTGVLPEYFETVGIPATAGRLLERSDGPGSEPVVVVSEDVVREYFGGEIPIGTRVGVAGGSMERWARIVGVVPRTRTHSLDGEVIPQIYYTIDQGDEVFFTPRSLNVIVQTAVPPEGLMADVRRTVGEIAPRLPVNDLGSLEDVLRRSVARPRLMVHLMASFALIALALSAIGIYGVVSYTVSKRTREMGIRQALGARRRTVARLVIREGLVPAVLGIAVALPLALAGGSLLSGLLYGVSPRDPAVFAALPVVLLLVAYVSCHLPARRASRLDLVEALRRE
jgi:predicted permease